MSGQGFPFQADALAFARWDYCQTPEAVPEFSDQLSCTLRARQCGSHIAATQDRAWLGMATGPLSSLLQPAVVTGWAGSESCVDVDTVGVCNLMSSDRYGPAFWEAVGRGRSILADDAIGRAQSGRPQRPPPLEADVQITPAVFGSVAWLVQHYK